MTMHIGKLLARLNPASARYGAVGGGVPELTPQDIAAALAFVPAGIGREIICRLWWPDGAALAAKDLDRMLMDAQLGEWKRRMDAMVTSQIAVAVADSLVARSRALARLDAARAHLWPRLGSESCYAAIRGAVLAEIAAASHCTKCDGRGHLMENARIVSCQPCFGSGIIKFGDRARAASIDRDESTYRRAWKPVYEWTERLCQDAVGPASRSLREALDQEAA
jgi:hypothetical protein